MRNARNKTLDLIVEKQEKRYTCLAKYIEMVKETNLGSICHIKWLDSIEEGEHRFFFKDVHFLMLVKEASE